MFLVISVLFCRFFSPLGMAPVVGLVGLGLFQRGFPAVGIAVGWNLLYTSGNCHDRASI